METYILHYNFLINWMYTCLIYKICYDVSLTNIASKRQDTKHMLIVLNDINQGEKITSVFRIRQIQQCSLNISTNFVLRKCNFCVNLVSKALECQSIRVKSLPNHFGAKDIIL